MAIKAVQAGGTAAAGARTNFLSPEVLEPARLLNVVIMWSGATAGDSFRVFLTRSSSPVDAPQPGDPSAFEALDITQAVTATSAVVIPLMKARLIQPPFRLALSYNNTGASAVTVTATLYYDTEAP